MKPVVRSYEESDRNFIFSSWLQGLYYGNDWFEEIPDYLFYKNYQLVLEQVLGNPKNHIKVACLDEDPDVILGYSVYSNDAIHWVFVKTAWRKMGIAKMLVPNNIKTVTHLTRTGKYLKRKFDLTFNPFF